MKNTIHKDSGWGFIKKIKEKNIGKNQAFADLDRTKFGLLKKLTAFQVIQVVTSLRAAAGDDGDGSACACENCYDA